MDPTENATDEVRRLRRTMRDLVALSTLPAVWIGLGPEGIARSLADVLLHTLSLDLIYVRLAGLAGEGVVEVVRCKHGSDAANVGTVRASLAPLLGADRAEPPAAIADPSGSGMLHVAVTRFGVGDDHGVLVAGSRNPDFPTERDRLLLGVGANQTAIVVQRRRAEERLQEQREWLATTLTSIGDAVIATDALGRVRLMNPVAEALTGWPQGDAAGRPIEEVFRIVNEHTRRPAEHPVARVLREGVIVGLANHTVLIARDGSEVPIEDSAAPIRGEDGTPTGVVMVFRDVTEERAAQRLVRQSEERHRTILESISDAFFALDRAWRFTYVNRQAEALLGRGRGDLLGKGIWEEYAPAVGTEFERSYRRAMAEGVTVTFEAFYPPHDRWYEVHAYPSSEGLSVYFRDVNERRRAEAELRASEERRQLALDSAGLGTWHIESGSNALTTDERFRTIFHGTNAPIGFEEAFAATHPDDRERVRERVAAAMRPDDPEPYVEEYRVVHPDGSTRWVLSKGRANFEPVEGGRRLVSLDGTVVDITERKRAEEEKARLVAASEQQRRIYETALSNTPDFHYVFDLEGRFIYVNAALLGLWQKGLEEAVGRDFFDLGYPPGLAARLQAQIRQVIDTKQPVRDDTPFTSHLGERQYEYIFVPVLGVGGAVVAVAGSTRDITERKRAEERVRRSESDLADFFENAAVGLHWVGPDGTILRANRAELDLLGYDRDEYVGRHIAEFHADDDAICDILRRLQAGEALHDYPARLRCKDGSLKDVLIDSSVLWEDGKFVHTRCFTRDVTEAKRADEELRAAKVEAESASRAKTQFLAVLSHELRTPLNPILLAASSMLDRPCEPEEIRPTLEMIRQNVNLQARLIDDLLDVMRIVQGKMPLHWEVADCHRVVDQAIQICRSEVSGHDLRLSVEADARHHHINADAARLQQVFWNLIKNAVKFTPEGGAITVRTRNTSEGGEDRIVVEVIDTGIGIEPEVLPTIWDPFQQGETTITRKFGGLGLGLAICKGVVEAHGGTLEAESPGKGRGTTFRVGFKVLPEAAIEGNGQPVGDALSVTPHRPSSLRILVVEDEPATLRLMARLLRGLGHAVTTADTIVSGCEAFEAGEFDLIVSDIGLPDGTGLDLMRRVVALRGPVPSIALTGYGMEEDIVRSREAGFTSHMTKPIDFAKLEAMIRQVASGGGQVGHA